jgi:hypothetical protein
MIDPLKVLVCTPAGDGRVECGYAGGLMAASSAHLFGNILFSAGCSDVRMVRNLIAHAFLKTQFEWMVSIDADICFSADDFKILMDYPPYELIENSDDTTVNEWGEAVIVCAEYARKVETLDPCRFGLGFTRIHRFVFDTLLNADDDDGKPRVGGFLHKGELITDYFPNGPGLDNTWFGEDTGFFHLCRLCGITPRVEQRTKLIHVGRKAYPYAPPG